MKNIISILFVLFISLSASAQDTLIGPHGGRIKIAQGYQIEALRCDNYIEIYLFNEVSDPIFNSEITGSVKFFYKDKAVNTPLLKYGLDGFSGKITSPEFSHYVVTMNLMDRIIISAKFNECIVPKK